MLNKQEFSDHLKNDLIPFWSGLYDNTYGGFYGSVDSDNNINKSAAKSAVLQTRLLWFYSSCFKELKEESLLRFADLQFKFIFEYMIDPADGGIFWEVEHDGKVKSDGKHTYALAFALYAISAYYSASQNKAALDAADRLFKFIETGFKDKYGYIELFSFDKSIDGATRTMNTLLHIIEAYAEYYDAVKTEDAKRGLRYALDLVIKRAYNDKLHRIECYFDKFMNPVGDVLSYGHDIESSWLIYRACEILGDDEIIRNLAPKLEKVASNVISKGFVDEGRNGIYYDCKDGENNKYRSWWVMSEAVVALVHRYVVYNDAQSIVLAENVWEYIKRYFISRYGEWHMQVSGTGEAVKSRSGLCGAWKCPYHNGRMCLELMKML